jgi:hypothetical protein
MFGADYPLLGYERLVGDWKAQHYSDDVLERIFTATRMLSLKA